MGDYENGCAELLDVVRIAREAGSLGSRATGESIPSLPGISALLALTRRAAQAQDGAARQSTWSAPTQ